MLFAVLLEAENYPIHANTIIRKTQSAIKDVV